MKEKIYVLLSYDSEFTDEVGCEVFKTRRALLDYLKDEIRGQALLDGLADEVHGWKEDCLENGDVDGAIAEMETAMDESGRWCAGDGLEFVLKEKQLIG